MTITRMHSGERSSKIVIHNETIYLTGQVAKNVEEDIQSQTLQCLQQIETLLEEAGSDNNHILSVQIFIKNMKDFSAMNVVWNKWFEIYQKPARACVQAQMARPAILIEMCVTAAAKA